MVSETCRRSIRIVWHVIAIVQIGIQLRIIRVIYTRRMLLVAEICILSLLALDVRVPVLHDDNLGMRKEPQTEYGFFTSVSAMVDAIVSSFLCLSRARKAFLYHSALIRSRRAVYEERAHQLSSFCITAAAFIFSITAYASMTYLFPRGCCHSLSLGSKKVDAQFHRRMISQLFRPRTTMFLTSHKSRMCPARIVGLHKDVVVVPGQTHTYLATNEHFSRYTQRTFCGSLSTQLYLTESLSKFISERNHVRIQ